VTGGGPPEGVVGEGKAWDRKNGKLLCEAIVLRLATLSFTHHPSEKIGENKSGNPRFGYKSG